MSEIPWPHDSLIATLQRGRECASAVHMADRPEHQQSYHLRRSQDWVIRLGDGTEESHQRSQRGFDRVWGYSHELFAMNAAEQGLTDAGVAVR